MNNRSENLNIKRALKGEFRDCQVFVRQGTGTACGWKFITIETSRENTEGMRELATNIACGNGNVGKYLTDYGQGNDYYRPEVLVQINKN